MAKDANELAQWLTEIGNGGDSSKFINWVSAKGLTPQRFAESVGKPAGGAAGAFGVDPNAGVPPRLQNNPAMMPPPGSYPTPSSAPPPPKPQSSMFGPPIQPIFGPNATASAPPPPPTTAAAPPVYPSGNDAMGRPDWIHAIAGTPPNSSPGVVPPPTATAAIAPPAPIPAVAPATVTAPIGTDQWMKEITAMGATSPTTGAPVGFAPPVTASVTPQKAQGQVPSSSSQADVVDTGPPLNMDSFGLGAPIAGALAASAAFAPIAPTAPLSAAPSEIGMGNIAPVSGNWADLATADAMAPSTAIAPGTDWSKLASGLEGISAPANPDVLKPSSPALPQRNALPTNTTIPALLAAIRMNPGRANSLKLG